MRCLRLAALLLALAACSSPSSASDNPSVPPPKTQDPRGQKPPGQKADGPKGDTPTPATAGGSGGSFILADLMHRVRDTVGPLLRGDDIPSSEAHMEDLFKKIRASAPAPWKSDWEAITGEALDGKPD